MSKTEHWNETETIIRTNRDGTKTVLTRLSTRAWDERCEYAVRFVEEWAAAKSVSAGKGRPMKERREVNARRYEHVVMVRLADGFETPLGTPTEFAKTYKVSRTGIAILVNTPHRQTAHGWTVKGREVPE